MLNKKFKRAVFSVGEKFDFPHYGEWTIVIHEQDDPNIHFLASASTYQQCCECFDIVPFGTAKNYYDGNYVGEVKVVAGNFEELSEEEVAKLMKKFAYDRDFIEFLKEYQTKYTSDGLDEFNIFFVGIYQRRTLLGGWLVCNEHNGFYYHDVWCKTENSEKEYICTAV